MRRHLHLVTDDAYEKAVAKHYEAGVRFIEAAFRGGAVRLVNDNRKECK